VSAIQARDHLCLYRASNVAIASRSPPPSPPTGFARGRFFTSKDRPHCHRNPRLFTESGRELVDYDDPFSRDPVIRLRQIKKAMAELLELGPIRQAGVDEKGRPLYELTDVGRWQTDAGRASHARDKGRLH